MGTDTEQPNFKKPASAQSCSTVELGGLMQEPLRPHDIRLMAQLMDEASDILAKMSVDVFDAMQIRWYLADELAGSAIMLRDEAALREKTPNVK